MGILFDSGTSAKTIVTEARYKRVFGGRVYVKEKETDIGIKVSVYPDANVYKDMEEEEIYCLKVDDNKYTEWYEWRNEEEWDIGQKMLRNFDYIWGVDMPNGKRGTPAYDEKPGKFSHLEEVRPPLKLDV